MHVDWRQIIALSIVLLAALSVGRRLWKQIANFRSRPGRGGDAGGGGGGCDGCPSSGQTSALPKAASSPLIQIQAKPPVHLRRPPAK